MSEMGIYGGRTNRDRVLAFVAEGDLVLAIAGVPALIGLAAGGIRAVTAGLADIWRLTGMLGLADTPALVPQLTSLGSMDTICPTVLFTSLRVEGRPLLDRAHFGGCLGLSYGRFGNDGGLGDILVSLLLDYFRLGR